ncbi:MAG: TylF/MycF/NovP-related O-methyltransferase [Maricaulaceae bacterium]|jgi:hypothetical protein
MSTFRQKIWTLKRRLASLWISACEFLLPRGYYVQMFPYCAERDLAKEIGAYNRGHNWPHLRDGNRALQAQVVLDFVKDLPEGDYAEVGTYQGNFGRMIFKRMTPAAKYFCFDTFEGFDDRDMKAEDDGVRQQFTDTSLEKVRQAITGGAADDNLVLRKGFFPDTFKGLGDRVWRFVLLDPDLYAPIKAGLELFWPKMTPGGLIMIHDYLNPGFAGARKAVDEYFLPRGIRPMVWPDVAGTALVVRAQETDAAAHLTAAE